MRDAKKRKEREKHRDNLDQKERDFCPYVNGPNKLIGINKEIHDIKIKKQFNLIGKERKKWQSPSFNMPPIAGIKKIANPVCQIR